MKEAEVDTVGILITLYLEKIRIWNTAYLRAIFGECK
jgi:hypothetical protein